jgi:hypothetical protein
MFNNLILLNESKYLAEKSPLGMRKHADAGAKELKILLGIQAFELYLETLRSN